MRAAALAALVLMLVTVACGAPAGTGQTTAPTEAVTASTATTDAVTTSTATTEVTTTSTAITEVTGSTVTTFGGKLEPIVVPTLPSTIPGYAEVDPATGLHVTGTPQVIDLSDYRLKVDGLVERELSLSYDDLRRLPKVTATPTLVCPGTFVDTTTWSGVPLYIILEMAGVRPEAKEIWMVAADGYESLLSPQDALAPENFLAYEWMGQPLPVLHGFPLRAVIPGKPGSYWVKWLIEIKVQ